MWAELGSAIGSEILGDMLSDKQDLGDLNASRDSQAHKNYEAQKEFAQHGITWKVEDAKRAGLHPLFALGGSGAAFQSNPIVLNEGAGSGSGQNISRSALASGSSEDRSLHDAQLALLAAQTEKEFAMSSYYNSEAARNRQIPSAPVPVPSGVMPQADAVVSAIAKDHVDMKADPQRSVMSNAPQVGAARNPMFSRYTVTEGGGHLDLPYSEEGPSESLEGLWNPLALGLTLYQNLSSLGRGAVDLLRHSRRGPFSHANRGQYQWLGDPNLVRDVWMNQKNRYIPKRLRR